MADAPASGIGFADFVAVLIVETLDSIVAAHTSQEERMRALDDAVRLTPEEFAATAISDEVLTAALIELFPDGKGGTTLVVGGPVPPTEVLAELHITLDTKSVEGAPPKQTLTTRGVRQVTNGLTLHLATRQLEAMREAASRGVPRVVVDGGTLRAKVRFTTSKATATPSPARGGAARGGGAGPVDSLAAGLVRFDTPLRTGILDSIRDLRLKVVTPIVGEPTPTDRAEIQGEVEIRFRTVL